MATALEELIAGISYVGGIEPEQAPAEPDETEDEDEEEEQ